MWEARNEWCVCSTRDGKLSLMTREYREDMIAICHIFEEEVPTHVVRVFNDVKDAILYIEDIELVNEIIENL